MRKRYACRRERTLASRLAHQPQESPFSGAIASAPESNQVESVVGFTADNQEISKPPRAEVTERPAAWRFGQGLARLRSGERALVCGSLCSAMPSRCDICGAMFGYRFVILPRRWPAACRGLQKEHVGLLCLCWVWIARDSVVIGFHSFLFHLIVLLRHLQVPVSGCLLHPNRQLRGWTARCRHFIPP